MSIHAKFTHQAKRNPTRVAVRANGKAITYDGLDKRANQLARYLQENGLKQGMVVGIFCDRTVDMIVAIYAVLKAGCAYLPLDKKYPQERLALLLAQSNAEFILTDQAMADSERLSNCVAQSLTLSKAANTLSQDDTQSTTHINCIAFTDRSIHSVIAQYSSDDLSGIASNSNQIAANNDSACSDDPNDHLAYLIYTSGSTGQPKGVMVAHRNTLALIQWAADYFTEHELQYVVASTSLNFDLSVFEIFVPLSVGGSILLVDDALCLADKSVDCTAITLLNTVPSVLQALLDVKACLPQQLTVNVAGEPLPQALVNRAFEQWNAKRVVNLYGPSETTTYSSVYSMTTPVSEAPAIGKAIAGTELFVLNDQLKPVTLGQTGELYIAGLGVSLGYWNNQPMTQERFIKIPKSLQNNSPDSPQALLSESNVSRMYRTGDIVMQREDGNLHYLGRVDEQVKIRGFRVELAEIEYQLSAIPAIKHAVVNVTTASNGQSRLIGYCLLEHSGTAKHTEQLFAEALTQLSLRLPVFMLPEQLIEVQDWAYTPNGKIDKSQLPQPTICVNQTKIVTPTTDTEISLRQLWGQLVNSDENEFGIHDHFFGVGGNSLLILQMMYRIESIFGVLVAQHDIGNCLTVAAIAAQIDKKLASQSDNAPCSMLAYSQETYTPASIQQENFWVLDSFLDHELTEPRLNENLVLGVPFYLHFPQAFDLARMQRALESVCRKHDVLRTGYSLVGTEIVAEVKDSFPTIHHQTIDCDDADSFARAARKALVGSKGRVFNLSNGHVITAIMLKNTRTPEAILAFAVHHIAFDGWSKSVFISDLLSAYLPCEFSLDAQEKADADFPKYSAFARWQHQQVLGSEWSEKLAAIANQGKQFELTNEFPTKAPRAGRKIFTGGTVRRSLTPKMANTIQLFAKSHNASLYDVMYSALSLVIAKEGGQRQCVIGTASANRLTAEQAKMIGCFTTSLLLYTDIPQQLPYLEFLSRLVKIKKSAFNNQAIQISASSSFFDLEVPIQQTHSPFFNVFLAEEINESGEYALEGSMVRVLHSEDDVSRFDLTCNYHLTDSGINLRWIYDEELYSEAAMNHYIDVFVDVLTQVITQPQQCISALTNPTKTQYSATSKPQTPILHGKQVALKSGDLLHHNFERAVENTPNAVAVYEGDNTFSFAQINHAANQLAVSLPQAIENTVVAVVTTHSVETIISILALWKAGAAYLPLDPKLPDARVAYMLAQANVVYCLQPSASNVNTLTLPNAIERLDVNRSLADITHTQSPTKNLSKCSVDNPLAYVLFTSGSTNEPKGVQVAHRSVINLMHAMQTLALQDDGGSWGISASFSFDASVQGLSQLCAGQAICLLTDTERLDTQCLASRLKSANVSVLDCTPSLLAQWYTEAPQLALPHLIIGGEAIDQSLWQQIVQRTQTNERRAYNAYGPTECTVNSTVALIAGDQPHLGEPLCNIQIQVVNTVGQRCAVDEQGEICVSGAGVAQGYLHSAMPVLPSDPEQTGVVYRTGDLGVLDAANRLTFLGRECGYVKHLGNRISPLEIESRLNTHEAVSRSHVCLIPLACSTSLVAFVEWQPNTMDGLDNRVLEDLKHHAATYLPTYMLPTRWVCIELWPVTITGKIDTKALAAKAYESVDITHAQTTIEHELQQVVNQLLHQEAQTSLNFSLSFAQLGGSSVQGAKLASLLNSNFSVSLSLVDILLATSMHELAQTIESKPSDTSSFGGFTIESSDEANVVEESI